VKTYINTIDEADAENLLGVVKDSVALLPETTVQMFV
jgi:hypothetical protein